MVCFINSVDGIEITVGEPVRGCRLWRSPLARGTHGSERVKSGVALSLDGRKGS